MTSEYNTCQSFMHLLLFSSLFSSHFLLPIFLLIFLLHWLFLRLLLILNESKLLVGNSILLVDFILDFYELLVQILVVVL